MDYNKEFTHAIDRMNIGLNNKLVYMHQNEEVQWHTEPSGKPMFPQKILLKTEVIFENPIYTDSKGNHKYGFNNSKIFIMDTGDCTDEELKNISIYWYKQDIYKYTAGELTEFISDISNNTGIFNDYPKIPIFNDLEGLDVVEVEIDRGKIITLI